MNYLQENVIISAGKSVMIHMIQIMGCRRRGVRSNKIEK
jgi:hypothetical protein